MDFLVQYRKRLDRNEDKPLGCLHLRLASVHEEVLVDMAVAAQVLEAGVPRRLCVPASRSRPAPGRPSPRLRPRGTLTEVFTQEAGGTPDAGPPRRAGAELGDMGQVRSRLTSHDTIGTCVKDHKAAISRRSAFMVVLESQLIRPSRCLGIEATARVMRSAAEQHE
ncbi:hypothetical protein GCM10023335_73270 [Streptomyces siamensis]|uniref:Uncharacterized protein n=1 Tax=Streptomyces siamensis TaxID=1274986 RepID=A0ABP9JHA6_9ACTN